MKKTKFISITLVIAIMLIGAGYAYWSDSVTLNSTVSTGEFNVVFGPCSGSNVKDYDNDPTSINPFGYNDRNGDYVNNHIPNDGNRIVTYPQNDTIPENADQEQNTLLIANKEIRFQLANVYPGSGGFFNFAIINNGSIPAKLENIKYVFNSGEHLKNQFIYTIGDVKLIRAIPNGYGGYNKSEETLNSEYIQYQTFDSFILGLKDILDDVELNSTDRIEFNFDEENGVGTSYDIYMNPEAKEFVNFNGETKKTEEERYSFNLVFEYTQWNKN